MKLEIYLNNQYREPYFQAYYTTYKGALNRIIKAFKIGRIAKDSFYVIRDDLQHIVCNAHYERNGDYLYICEKDNIGLNHKETIINR